MLDFAGMVAEIDKVLKINQSGALFIVSDNRMARLYIQDGEIISLSYNRKTGLEAFAELKQIVQAKVGFHEGQKGQVDDSLPDTTTIMTDLREGMTNNHLESSFFKVDESDEKLKQIKDAYIGVIGPIGAMLFAESLEESEDLASLLTSLRQQMVDDSDVYEFNASLVKVGILQAD